MKKLFLIFLPFISVIFLIGCTNTKPSPTETTKPTPTPSQESVIKYEIVYTAINQRYDGGINYYVFIDPVDLSNNNFKNDIKNLIKKIVSDKSKKISVDICDKREVLDLVYKEYGDNSFTKPLTKDEENERAIHYIATFDGELKTGGYFNTLSFYAATFTDNPIVGKYVETIEFNP